MANLIDFDILYKKTTGTGTLVLLLGTLALSLSLLVSYSCYCSRINQCLWQSPEVDGFHEGANVCCAAARVGAGLRSI
jgi:hypothetical protein